MKLSMSLCSYTALLIHCLGKTQWCYAKAFVTGINKMNKLLLFFFEQQYLVIALRIKWLNAEQKRVKP